MVGAGGIVWTQAAKGLIHHELPAQSDKELHGLQFFVNLHAQHKWSEPCVFWLEKEEIPIWQNNTGNRVRVVVGEFEGKTSPLVPA